ncbi:MAG: hypothetical protein JKY88_02605 [Pseudomonadales bacterium]|nr:hypothetical protein [Pseudomonadales bacterium]
MRINTITRSMSKEEVLSFFLTHIVIAEEKTINLNPQMLFELMSLASEAESILTDKDDLIPHEVIESLAKSFIEGYL